MSIARPQFSIVGFCFSSAALAAITSLGGCQHQSSYGTDEAAVASRATASSGMPRTDTVAVRATKSSAASESTASNSTASNSPASNSPASKSTGPIADTTDATATQPDVADVPTVREVNFDALKFAHEKGAPFDRSLLTPKVQQLDGKPIRIRGYILPSFKQSGLTEFVLVRDNLQCCFGKGAALFDCIIVQMEKGTSAEYSIRPVTVEGTFKIKEWRGIEDEIMAVYHLDGRSVK